MMPHPLSKIQEKKIKKLAERIRQVRAAKGLTLEQVAHAIGKDPQSIHRLEVGKINPSYVYLTEVCEGLGIEVSELLKDI